MTTLSAPLGSMPPVEIFTALPGSRIKSGTSPIKIVPAISSQAGFDSEAPKVAFAATAYPSMVALLKPGISFSAKRSLARTLEKASETGIISAFTGENLSVNAITSSRVFTLKK